MIIVALLHSIILILTCDVYSFLGSVQSVFEVPGEIPSGSQFSLQSTVTVRDPASENEVFLPCWFCRYSRMNILLRTLCMCLKDEPGHLCHLETTRKMCPNNLPSYNFVLHCLIYMDVQLFQCLYFTLYVFEQRICLVQLVKT